ncbi:murinoglobulin-2-like [Plodia interpunctella]|uniref:murinoglobulin-2-like n=1 Tax=Plodia interpunctella TaxID=58824 RepID=UPI002368EA48|nr:murinoglobulin-2-like [Plodia interpunctella]
MVFFFDVTQTMRRVFIVFLFMRFIDCDVPGNLTSVNPCTDRNHLFLAPGVLSAGGSNRACVSRFYTDGTAHMSLTIRTEDNKFITSSRELATGDGGCLDITVPKKPNTKVDLAINLRYAEAKCTWERHVTLRISSSKLVAIHTQRARYRPGDTLRVRIFAFKTNLSPAPGAIDEIWLEGPRGAWDGSRAAQWSHVPTRMGIAQVQHEIDELAPTGTWTVRARLSDGSQGAAAFLVSNYELPPFQMSVRHAAKVLKTSDRLVWTVCVRYPWTEAVEGMLVIRIRGAGSSAGGGIRTAVRLKAPRACHRHAAAAKRIGLDDLNSPDVVVADFSFQEEGTGTWQNTTVVSQVIDKAISLEFLTNHRSVIAPGLPYKLKIKATLWDEKPASNELIHVCRIPVINPAENSSSSKTCNDVITDEKGVGRVMFDTADDSAPYYKFEATLHNDSTISAPPLLLPSQRGSSVHAALGPLRADKQSDRTFVPLYLSMKNASRPITVHFVVITRGGIIYRWGATTQCAIPNAGDHYQVASRNGHCSNNPDLNTVHTALEVNDNNTSDALLDRHLLRVMLPIKVTHQMCPDSHLIAYFYYGDELVSTSKHFEMEECFAHKVETVWLSRQVAPGSLARFRIKTDTRALCALAAIDIAAKIPQSPTMASTLLAALKRLLETNRNLTEYDAAGQCFFVSDSQGLASSSIELTARWLAAAGVRLVGGEEIPTRCEPAPAAMFDSEVTVPRSDFSEAWLWRLIDVAANSTAIHSARAPDSISKFEANAVCVTKTGLAVSAPATLQVFREFFIHADSPRRLRRGDSTIVKYRLFNYLYEPLSVQIQILTDPHLEGPVSYVETACVGARASCARPVRVRARLAGAARLSVRARAVRDANCGNTTNTGLSDEVIIRITVDPEGVPVYDHQSALLCAEGSVESNSSQISWSWPAVDAVPGTEMLTMWAVGDIAGPLLADADSLVLLPRGCGEQNMARLATNLLALSQLSVLSPAAATARAHVARGFTRQLQYVHPQGGFSAFGATDATPSTWLTAFSLKYLRKAHKILSPGLPSPPALDKAEQWLLRQQMENGCFRNEGQVFHRELKGGLNEDGEIASIALTAYVITALMESSNQLSPRVVANTLSCLRAMPLMKTKSPARVYAQTLLAYTFMRLRRYEDDLRKTNEAGYLENRKAAGLEDDEEVRVLAALLKIAKRSGDFVWWETSSLSTSVEATGYALLALSRCPAQCAGEARGALRWLATRANPAGGFIATQDTLVALEALTTWMSIQPLPSANLTVTARSGHSTQRVTLTPGVKVPEVAKLEVSDRLHVDVKGSGCALVQATRSYATLSSDDDSDKQLSVQVTVHTDGQFSCDTNNTACFCAAVIETCVVWLGAFPGMALLEVSLPGGYSVDAAMLYSMLQQTNELLRRIELSPNSGRVTLYLGTRDGSDSLGHGGHRCYPIHAMGPKAKTKPAYAKIIDYYEPTINDTQMYTIPEECLPRITGDTNEYVRSDNLYAKSKSLEDSDELVIMNEYSFEDIPEGIPLDDPLYADNLTQDDDNKTTIAGVYIATDKPDTNQTGSTVDIFEDYNSVMQNTEGSELQVDKSYKINNLDGVHIINSQDKKRIYEIPSNVAQANVENNIVSVNKHKHVIEERDDEKEREKIASETEQDNPKLSSFHVVDSEKDLDVPSGIEGPIPAVLLPPENFVPTVALPPSIPSGVPPPILPPPEIYRSFNLNYYPAQDALSYYFNPENPYTNYRRYYSPVVG